MTPEERREIAIVLTEVIRNQADPLAALRSWGIEELLVEEPAAALAPLYRARGQYLLTHVPLELLHAEAYVLPLADAPQGLELCGALLGHDPASLPLRVIVLGHDRELRAVPVSELTVAKVPGHGSAPTLSVSGPAGAGEPLTDRGIRPLLVRLLAEELCGVVAAMLGLAREHAGVRTQFGRTLSAFQVVRHKLVDVHVDLAAAEALLVAAWERPESALAAETAKVWAGRAFTIAARHTAQVCGGIGFTEEFGLYHGIHRGNLLDGLLVGAGTGTSALGRRLIAAGSVPRALVWDEIVEADQ